VSGQHGVPNLHRELPWWLARPSSDPLFLIYARAYALATLLRLTLPDATQTSWLAVVVVQGAGALVVGATGGLVGWVLCALGALSGILWLQDQLTQSAYLLACALAAIACFAGSRERRSARMGDGLTQTVRVLTLLVYLLAGFHKLNADFLNPTTSCANAGLRALATHGHDAPLLSDGVMDAAVWPPFFLTIEIGLPLMALWRPGPAVVGLAAFHVPLTIIFAPGFAFTMMSGWVCLLGYDRLRAIAETLKRRWPLVLTVGLLPAAVSALTFFPQRVRTDPDWRLKEAVLWCAVALLATTWWRHREAFRGRTIWRGPHPAPAVTGLLAFGFVAHALTPYLGLGFHRTGAMLSNLRIDRGCENHLLVPTAIRLVDPYVVVEDIRFAPDRAVAGFEDETRARLWSLAALWRARAHWCSKHPEPLALTARHDGRRVEISDLCAPDGWPWPEPLATNMRRFQVNLTTKCPQACVH